MRCAMPVDCITMVPRPSESRDPTPAMNRARYYAHNARLTRRAETQATLLAARKQAAGERLVASVAATAAGSAYPRGPRHVSAHEGDVMNPPAGAPFSAPSGCKSESDYRAAPRDAFRAARAVMLSAHTTDKSVNAATRKLFPVANTPAAIAKLGVEGVKPYLKTVWPLQHEVQEPHWARTADRRSTRRRGTQQPRGTGGIAGVGRKTASIILNMVFGHRNCGDTHIFRVANRTGFGTRQHARAVETNSSRRLRRNT